MKNILQLLLKYSAKAILAKYQPDIIGITGSVGKTTTKQAIIQVLADNFKVRGNIKNYNNEIGLPLTIIGALTAKRSLFGWFVIFSKVITKDIDISSMPLWISDQGITDVITYKIDGRIMDLFTIYKINLYIGIKCESPDEIIQSYLIGKLKSDEKIILEINKNKYER